MNAYDIELFLLPSSLKVMLGIPVLQKDSNLCFAKEACFKRPFRNCLRE